MRTYWLMLLLFIACLCYIGYRTFDAPINARFFYVCYLIAYCFIGAYILPIMYTVCKETEITHV